MTDLVAPAAAAYANDHTTPPEGQLVEIARWTQTQTSSPQMMSGMPEARLLEALIVTSGARRALEIGTFTGFGAVLMASAMPRDGKVITLEFNENNAAVARRHIEASRYADRIQLIVGDARATLADLEGPFDLVYLDAWKSDYPAYYDGIVPKLAERGVIVADNLFRGGRVLDHAVDDDDTAGSRDYARRVQEDDRMHNVLLTVGDGVMLAWRRPEGG